MSLGDPGGENLPLPGCDLTLLWDGQFMAMLLEHHGLSTLQVVTELSWYYLSGV